MTAGGLSRILSSIHVITIFGPGMAFASRSKGQAVGG
jgi:hypothetical protein